MPQQHPRTDRWSSAVLAYPMHGQHKLLAEGYRTRDGHVIEQLGGTLRAHGGVGVVSRPEPLVLPRQRSHHLAALGTSSIETRTIRIPDPTNRRRWWVTSAGAYPVIGPAAAVTPAIVWNPFTALAPSGRTPFAGARVTVLDLLDDWTQHYAFAAIRPQVEAAYRAAFARATHVTANAEGTAALARRFGRDDVVLIPNGCDPERFDTTSTADGPATVGYVGKIGRRLDLPGIVATVNAHPTVRFVFAGPVLDDDHRAPLATLPNVELLGDVHYSDLPALLRTFDAGWVPHRVGDHEVGGDVIKTYEYRAAGLPTLSTPVQGAGTRGVSGVTTAPVADHADILGDWFAGGPRLPRQPAEIPRSTTWADKSAQVLDLLLNPTTGAATAPVPR